MKKFIEFDAYHLIRIDQITELAMFANDAEEAWWTILIKMQDGSTATIKSAFENVEPIFKRIKAEIAE